MNINVSGHSNETILNFKHINKTAVNKKMDKSKFDKDGKLKQGVHQEYFKNGSLSCEGILKREKKPENGNTFLQMDN